MRARLTALAAAIVLVALGIGIGAGPLQHDSAEQERAEDARRSAARELADRAESAGELRTFADRYAGASAARVVSGSLEGRKVAIVSFPEADADRVRLLEGLVHAAGGDVTAQVTLAAELFDQVNQGLLDALTRQIAAQTPGLTTPPGASAYGVFGALLGRAVGVPPSAHAVGAPYDETAISVLSGLEAGKVVGSSEVSQRAGLTLFLLPEGSGEESLSAAQELIAAYAGQYPTVVAGPGASARPGGLLAAVRESDAVLSTVDSVDTSTGRVAAVLALAARTRGVKGDYGAVGEVAGAIPPFA